MYAIRSYYEHKPPPAIPVTKLAGEQLKHGHGDQIGYDQPPARAEFYSKGLHDARQGDGDHG